MAAVLSPVVARGDLVRLVSPASTPDPAWVATCVGVLESWGLVVDVGTHALDRHGYLAGTDDARLDDLNRAFRDPRVRAVVATRGGAGAYRIADSLDFDAVRADPKPLVGFSDITYLHLALWRRCRLASVHGTLAGPNASATVRRLLMDTGPVTLPSDRAALSAGAHVAGRVSGPLVGGNLTAVASSVGVRLEPLDDAILFLEAPRGIGLGLVDRQLTQLRAAGLLDRVAGVALGLFTGFDGYVDRGWDVVDVLRDRLCTLGVPVLGGIDAGHPEPTGPEGGDQLGLTIGPVATLDADAGTLVVGPCTRPRERAG